MVQIEKEIRIMARWLKYYDKYRHFPFEKKRVNVSLSYDLLDNFKNKNLSKEIEENLNRNI